MFRVYRGRGRSPRRAGAIIITIVTRSSGRGRSPPLSACSVVRFVFSSCDSPRCFDGAECGQRRSLYQRTSAHVLAFIISVMEDSEDIAGPSFNGSEVDVSSFQLYGVVVRDDFTGMVVIGGPTNDLVPLRSVFNFGFGGTAVGTCVAVNSGPLSDYWLTERFSVR